MTSPAINHTGERALWRAVISQALTDAVTTSPSFAADREEARHWLTTPNADFDEACALAEVEPDKVRALAWTTIEQAEHRGPRRSRKVANLYTFDGLTLTLDQWSERTGISRPTLWSRIRRDWPIELTLTTPLARTGPRRRSHPGGGSELSPKARGPAGGASREIAAK